jgi:hypothetical protein
MIPIPADLADERLLSSHQIAELDNTSLKSVRRKITSGELPIVRRSAKCVRVGDWRAAREVDAA